MKRGTVRSRDVDITEGRHKEARGVRNVGLEKDAKDQLHGTQDERGYNECDTDARC